MDQTTALAFIDQFEIVGGNNDSRDPTDDEKFILREFVLQLFDADPVVYEVHTSEQTGPSGPNEFTKHSPAAQSKSVRQPLLVWPDGYCRFPDGTIAVPFGKKEDFDFGYEIGFDEGMEMVQKAIAAKEASFPQPSPTAVVLDDERAAFDELVNSIPANRSMGPWEIWQAARAASPQPVEQTRALTPEWLWSQLMDYCRKQGTAPANNPRLFEIVDNARALTAARPASGETE